MKRFYGIAQKTLLAASLAVLPLAAEDSSARGAMSHDSSSGSTMDGTAGSTSNRANAGDAGRTAGVSSFGNNDANDGFDLGWMGLIGLAGLAGLMRPKRAHVNTHDHNGAVNTNLPGSQHDRY